MRTHSTVTVEDVRERVRAGGLLPARGAVVAMVSGGRDSTCLLDVVVALCGAERVRALHVNYRLRTESDDDERHCRELCERMAIQMEVVRASREENAVGNLQAWARELRYRAAGELAERLEGAHAVDVPGVVPGVRSVRAGERAVVASGHTATDQVETILYRLAASPGRRALLGMPAAEGRLVRPLLGVTREQTAEYCRARELAWREDASNDSERYARSRVRHRLVEALSSVHPAAQTNVLRTAELLREETALLDTLVDGELAGGSDIGIERLRELPPALQRLVMIRLAEETAGTFVPQAGERVAEVLALAARGGRAELHVGGLVGAVVDAGRLRMIRIPSRGA